jgi:hypothetical protein
MHWMEQRKSGSAERDACVTEMLQDLFGDGITSQAYRQTPTRGRSCYQHLSDDSILDVKGIGRSPGSYLYRQHLDMRLGHMAGVNNAQCVALTPDDPFPFLVSVWRNDDVLL